MVDMYSGKTATLDPSDKCWSLVILMQLGSSEFQSVANVVLGREELFVH